MAKKLRELMIVLIIGGIAGLLVQVAYWNMWAGIILITLALIGSMLTGVNVTIRIIQDGDLKIKGNEQ